MPWTGARPHVGPSAAEACPHSTLRVQEGRPFPAFRRRPSHPCHASADQAFSIRLVYHVMRQQGKCAAHAGQRDRRKLLFSASRALNGAAWRARDAHVATAATEVLRHSWSNKRCSRHTATVCTHYRREPSPRPCARHHHSAAHSCARCRSTAATAATPGSAAASPTSTLPLLHRLSPSSLSTLPAGH